MQHRGCSLVKVPQVGKSHEPLDGASAGLLWLGTLAYQPIMGTESAISSLVKSCRHKQS